MKKVYLLLAILIQVSIAFSQTHFVKGNISAGENQMNIRIVSADIGGTALQAGDEIAVFDGNLCCGVVLLDKPIVLGDETTYAILDAAADDGSGNGFIQSHKMYFRFWDSSADIEYYNVIPIVKDNTNTNVNNEFKVGETVFVNASTANTDKTWTDLGSTWADPDAWEPAGVPEPKDNVTIPAGIPAPILTATDVANCGSLTFGSGVTMTFPSSSSGTASLIVAANISGTPTVKFRRYILANGWHMVSSPLSGQTAGGFLSVSPNSTGVATKSPSRGMMDYDESINDWNTFFTNGSTDPISPGKGFSIRRESTAGALEFTGSLMNDDVMVAVSKSNKGWNLIGNPFTSAMYVKQEVFGFIVKNSGILDDSYQAIYLWDPTINAPIGGYTVVNNNEGQANLASGQGFFIKTKSSGNVNFTKQMQVHETNASFKSATILWPSIVLNAKAGDISSSTKITFNEEMTLGLDPGYDAGILRNGHGFDIYSKLVTDNGVDFMVQTLPGKSTDKYIIPVGVDATKGGEIVFSAKSLNLPTGYEVILEDKLTNTLTNLQSGELYVANLASNTKGTGRFYLQVGSSLQTGIQEIKKNELVVYTLNKTVYIKGDVSSNAQFVVYSIDGRIIDRFGATSQNLNQKSTAGYTPGIYFISVQSTNKYKPVKFVVGN